MEMKIIFIFINILILFLLYSIQPVKSLNVELIAQVFRHGHRYSVYNLFDGKLNIYLKTQT